MKCVCFSDFFHPFYHFLCCLSPPTQSCHLRSFLCYHGLFIILHPSCLSPLPFNIIIFLPQNISVHSILPYCSPLKLESSVVSAVIIILTPIILGLLTFFSPPANWVTLHSSHACHINLTSRRLSLMMPLFCSLMCFSFLFPSVKTSLPGACQKSLD